MFVMFIFKFKTADSMICYPNCLKSKYFEIGGSLDFLDIDHNQPLIHNSSEKNLLNTIIYSTDIRSIKSTYTNGEKKVNVYAIILSSEIENISGVKWKE